MMTSASVDGGNEIASQLNVNVDERLVAGTGYGLGRVTEVLAGLVRCFQTGLVRMYALCMLIGVVGIALVVTYLAKGGH